MALNLILKKAFALPTRNAIHIYPQLQEQPKNSPFKEVMGVRLPIWEKIERKHSIKTRPGFTHFDDRQPQNHLAVQLVANKKTHSEELKEDYKQSVKNPFILGDKPKETPRTFTFTTEVLQTSLKKATPTAAQLIGRQYFDAIITSGVLEKKVGKFLYQQMNDFMTTKIKEEGLDPKFMFVTSILTNRTRRVRKIRYQARGRGYSTYRDFCVFKVTVTEKPIKEFYRMMIEGKSPSYITYLMREYLTKKDSDFEEVRKLQPFLTAKGRQQQRLMFKRRVLSKWLEYKRAGHFVRLRHVKDMVMETEIADFEAKYKMFFKTPEELRIERIQERRQNLDKMTLT